jgi:two-component system chemotaxis sensor kinase CheA
METRSDEFVMQAREHLTDLELDLLALEKPGKQADLRERIDRCLRVVHSLKGDAGFLGYAAIRTLANAIETVLEDMRNERTVATTAAIERLLAARDRLATLVDDLENSHTADLKEILSQLKADERAPPRAPQAWDIDLRQVNGQRSDRLAQFFSTFEECGVISAACLKMASCDLTRELPRGSIRFHAQLASSTPPDEIRRKLGLPAMGAQTERALPLSIDLVEWVHASQHSLGKLLADLERLGILEDPRVDFGTCDFAKMLPGLNYLRRTLINGSAFHLAVASSSRRMLQLRAQRLPRRYRRHQPLRARLSLPQLSRRNTIRRLRCGSASNSWTG